MGKEKDPPGDGSILDPEKIREALKHAKSFDALERPDDEADRDGKHVGTCTACHGNVIQKIEHGYSLPTMRLPAGRASRKYRTTTKRFFCSKCGISYEFPPPRVLT